MNIQCQPNQLHKRKAQEQESSEGRLVWGVGSFFLVLFDLLLRACFDSAVATIRVHWVAVSERHVDDCLYQFHLELWQELSGVAELWF